VPLIFASALLLQAIATLKQADEQDRCLASWAAALASHAPWQMLPEIKAADAPIFQAIAAAHAVSHLPPSLAEELRAHAMHALAAVVDREARLVLIGRMLAASAGQSWPELQSLGMEMLVSSHFSFSLVDKVRSACTLIPFFDGPSQARMVAATLIAIRDTWEEQQATELAEFSSVLPEDLIEDAVRIISDMHHKEFAAMAARALLRRAPTQYLALLQLIVGTDDWIADDGVFNAIMVHDRECEVARVLAQYSSQLWSRTISVPPHSSRAELMETLIRIVPLVDKFDRSGANEQIVESSFKVTQWWP
jgi:hypothetical protein